MNPAPPLQRECRQKCNKYKYWWSVKGSHVAWRMMDYDHCIQSCVRKSAVEQQPELLGAQYPVYKDRPVSKNV